MPQKSARSRSFLSTYSKRTKKAVASSMGSGIVAKLPLISNVMLGILPVGNGPKNKYYMSLRQGNKEKKGIWK